MARRAVPCLRAAVLAAALAQAAPLAAQDTPVGSIIAIDAGGAPGAPPGDAPLDPATRLCLAKDQVALFASDRVTFQIAGEACVTLAEAEAEAFANQGWALRSQAAEEAGERYSAALDSGDEGAQDRAFEEYREASEAAGETHWEDEIARSVEEQRAARDYAEKIKNMPPAAGPVPGWPTPSTPLGPRPIIFRLASGSPSVLARFPRGMIVQPSTALCLAGGEQLTISSSIGQSATYTGPGCLKRQGKPTRENIGAFVFG